LIINLHEVSVTQSL